VTWDIWTTQEIDLSELWSHELRAAAEHTREFDITAIRNFARKALAA